jgi:hypothetical protein
VSESWGRDVRSCCKFGKVWFICTVLCSLAMCKPLFLSVSFYFSLQVIIKIIQFQKALKRLTFQYLWRVLCMTIPIILNRKGTGSIGQMY